MQKLSDDYICPSCYSNSLATFYEVKNIPVHSNLMMNTQPEAVAFPRRDLTLGLCNHCGFITNVIFDQTTQDYSPIYEDQQSFSPTFNKFAQNLAERLVKKYNLCEKDIIEIGCSKGDFLISICELGNNRGVGFDPTCVAGRVQSKATDQITFIRDYYSERYADYKGDMILCRHTLEHIYPTADFLATIRRSVSNNLDCIIFFEVPDTIRVLRELAFWDIYYEHCSYFSPGSLARLFRFCGFEVIDLIRDYDDQYLLIEAKPVAQPSERIYELEENIEQIANDVKFFESHIGKELENRRQYFKNLHANHTRIVIWGSGSKCVAYLTTLGINDEIDYIVDINPHRHGKYIPGVGKKIMSPEYLKQFQPDLVIVMNPIYQSEIEKTIHDMGLTPEIASV